MAAPEAPPGPGVTAADVERVYRAVLGRPPENAAVVANFLDVPDLHALYRLFLESDEFRLRRGEAPRSRPPLPLLAPSAPIEDRAAPQEADRLLAAVASYWGRIGREEPHWSVLTEDRFRTANLAGNEAVFYEGGASDLALAEDAVARHWTRPGRPARVVEYGCGVGRVTVHLCAAFAEVVGCDISPPHLRHAAAACRARGLTNFRPYQVAIGALAPEGPADLWFSRLVLQHNPPPVQRMILEESLRRLAPGGLAVFQAVTHWKGEGFRVRDYLARAGGAGMGMHAIPQEVVTDILREAGCAVMSVREDTFKAVGDPAECTSIHVVARRER